MWSIISRMLQKSACGLCAAPRSSSQILCEACLEELPRLDHACPVCSLPLTHSPRPPQPCGECIAHPPPFGASHIPLLYAAPVNDLISHFKYHHALAYGRLLGDLLAQHTANFCEEIDWLVPIPLHDSRLKERGFNQAAELARRIAQVHSIPVQYQSLLRIHGALPQRGANRHTRQAQMRQAFRCSDMPTGARVALIDDVVTTGATVRAAAQALKKAGAAEVTVWAVARTPRVMAR